ncbi:MAG: tetratricopeptide repeat protein [Acidobacteriota bacterium]
MAPDSGALPSKSEVRRQRVDAAMRGLVVRNGRVEVDGALGAASHGPSDASAADRLLAQGRVLAAVDAAASAVLARGLAPDFEVLGRCLLAARQPERALAAFDTSLDRGVDVADRVLAQRGAARALLALSRLDDAAERLETIVEDEPDDPWAHLLLAKIRLAAGLDARAEHHLEVAARAADTVDGRSAARLLARRLRGGSPTVDVRPANASDFTLAPAARVDATGGVDGANETSVIALADSQVILAGWNDGRDGAPRLGAAVSVDRGATWSDEIVERPPGVSAEIWGDPMTAVDSRTGDLFVGGIAFPIAEPEGAVFVARRPAGGPLGDATLVYQGAEIIDKCWMAAGPAPDEPDATRVYVAYSLGLQVSADGGGTWTPPLGLGLVHGILPRVDPAGELLLGYYELGVIPRRFWLRRSTDGGQSVGAASMVADLMTVGLGDQVPGFFRVADFGSFALDPRDGALYFVYADVETAGDVDLFLTSSTDGGATWTEPHAFRTADHESSDQFMPWLEIDASGRQHLVFFDTRDVAQDDSAANAWLDIYYATSVDRGASWAEARLTETSFPSVGSTFPTGVAQFLGDYLGLATAEASAYPVYPVVVDGHAEIHARRVEFGDVFRDGFESGNLEAWDGASP